MKDFLSQRITCPHCGHHIHLDLDASSGDQDY
ncbi:MAG TPA: CPXCG motif-containing cysteine-rich protein, partial [Pseudoalteromonas sp.]